MSKKGFLSIFNKSILNEPGDEMSARITESNRKVLKISKNRGKSKYSSTKYPNGTTVETRTTKFD